eukprot:scaffold23767_cov62-Phaeocystis_antarctica.AAC.9
MPQHATGARPTGTDLAACERHQRVASTTSRGSQLEGQEVRAEPRADLAPHAAVAQCTAVAVTPCEEQRERLFRRLRWALDATSCEEGGRGCRGAEAVLIDRRPHRSHARPHTWRH